MNNKDDRYYLLNMLIFAGKINELLANQTRHQFNENELLRVSITHWLQVIGEAARHVSDEFQSTHPEIPWRAMVGMRNRIVHDYLGIDDNMIWATATHRIPELIAQLEQIDSL